MHCWNAIREVAVEFEWLMLRIKLLAKWVFGQLWRIITSSYEVQMTPRLWQRLHLISLYIFRDLFESQFILLVGWNRARSKPIDKICFRSDFCSASAKRCLRRITGVNLSIIWRNFLLVRCISLNYLSVDINITRIGVTSEKLWPKYKQCSRSKNL